MNIVCKEYSRIYSKYLNIRYTLNRPRASISRNVRLHVRLFRKDKADFKFIAIKFR